MDVAAETPPMPSTITFNPGFVILSFVVSFIGNVTALEIISRRHGDVWSLFRWLQILLSAVALGAIGFWGVALVANSAMILDDGQLDRQVFYHPGYFAGSLAAPIITSSLAFFVLCLQYHGRCVRALSILVSGTLNGLSFFAMQYIGSCGIKNYAVIRRPGHLAGAIIIACAACIALSVVIAQFPGKFMDSLKWRLGCACVLAAAITSAYYEALYGADYTWRSPRGDPAWQRRGTLIAALVMTIVAGAMTCIIWFLSRIRRNLLSVRAQQVVLVDTYFDPEGKLMVLREGMLPCRKIIGDGESKSLEEDFNTNHPAFLWAFSCSRNWPCIQPWLQPLRRHIRAVKTTERLERVDSSLDWSTGHHVSAEDISYLTAFRERFCIAAADLASSQRVRLEDSGTILNAVMASGTLDRFRLATRNFNPWFALRRLPLVGDVETQALEAEPFGRGQVVFRIKKVEKRDVPRYQSIGYRFMSVEKAVPRFAEIMQVPRDYLKRHLIQARTSAMDVDHYKKRPEGVRLACFALKPGLSSKHPSWDVLVTPDRHANLPIVHMWPENKMQDYKGFLEALNGRSVAESLEYLRSRSSSLDGDEEAFSKRFKRAIEALSEQVAESFFRKAKVSSRLVQVPMNSPKGDYRYYTLIVIHAMLDIHDCALQHPERLSYTSLRNMICEQRASESLDVDPVFRRQVDEEFGILLQDYIVGPSAEEEEPKTTIASRRSSARAKSSKQGGGRAIALRSLVTSVTSIRHSAGAFDQGSIEEAPKSPATSTRSLPYSPTIAESEEGGQESTKTSSDVELHRTESRVALIGEEQRSFHSSTTLATAPPRDKTYLEELFEMATADYQRRRFA